MKSSNFNCQRLQHFRQISLRLSWVAMTCYATVSHLAHLKRILTLRWKLLRRWAQSQCCLNFTTPLRLCPCHDFSNAFANAASMKSIESPTEWRSDSVQYFLKLAPCQAFTPERSGMSIGCTQAVMVINLLLIPSPISFAIEALRLPLLTSPLEITGAAKIPSCG